MAWIRKQAIEPAVPNVPAHGNGNGNGNGNGATPAEAPRNRSTAAVAEPEGWYVALKRELHQQVIGSMDLSSIGKLGNEQLRAEVRRQAEALCKRRSDLLSLEEREQLVNEVLDETFGLGPLETLMRDPAVSDILINGPKSVFVERKGRLEGTSIAFHDNHHLLQIIQRIVGRMGRRIDETCPMADARLPDGSRLNVVIPPLAIDGPLVSIRRFGVR